MNDQVDREIIIKYAKQIGIATAMLLILYGIILIFDSFLDMTGVYVSYYLWVFYQILVAILAIFVGIRLYSASRKIRVADFDLIKRGRFIQFLALSLVCIIFVSVIPNPLSYFPEAEEGVIQTNIRVFPSDNENFIGYFSFDYEKVHCSFNIYMDSVDINRVGNRAKEKGFTCEFHLDNSVGAAFPQTINLIEKVYANLQPGVHFCCNGTHTLVYWLGLIDRTWLNQTLRTVLVASDQELARTHTFSGSIQWYLFDREANWTILKQYLGSFQETHSITADTMTEHWSNGHFMYAVDYVTVSSKVQVRLGLTIKVINFTSNINVLGWTDLRVDTPYKIDQNAIQDVFKTIFKDLDLHINWLNNVSFAENWLGEFC